MFRRVERQVESNDCLSLFLCFSLNIDILPTEHQKKFPFKGGFVRQKHLGKMIKIDFFDANGRFVVRHSVEMDTMRKFPIIWARIYCKSVFFYYKSAGSAKITFGGVSYRVDRNE